MGTKIQRAVGVGAPFIYVFPAPVVEKRNPTTSDVNYPLGQVWLNDISLPATDFVYLGAGIWDSGGVAPATTTTYGTVLLTDNHEPVATKFYADNLAIAGAPVATTGVQGIVFLATNAQAAAGTISTNSAIIPSSLAFALSNSAALPIGNTTAGSGAFTTLAASGNATVGGTLGVTGTSTLAAVSATSGTFSTTLGVTGASTFSSGTFSTTLGVTGASTFSSGTFSTTLGVTGASTFSSGTFSTTLGVTGLSTLGGVTALGALNLNTSGAAVTNIGGSSGLITITSGAGGLTAIGSGNTIQLFNDNDANLITLGSTTSGATLNLQAGDTGTGIVMAGSVGCPILIGATAQTATITLGSSTAANSVLIQNGINTGAQITSIANGATASTSTVNILSGTGSASTALLHMANNPRVTTIDLGNVAPAAARVTTIAGGNSAQNDTVSIFPGVPTANAQIFNLFSGNASGGTQTVNIGTGTNALALNLGTGATGIKTIAIGGTAANVITLGNTQTGGSISLGAAMTTGTINIGGTGLQTGTITLGGGTGAQTINLATGGTGVKTVNIATGAVANVTTIGTTTASSSVTINAPVAVAFSSSVTTAPANSNTATAAFVTSLTANTGVQNTTGYDLLCNINFTVTSATSGVITLGVGSGSSPTANTAVGAFTNAVQSVVSLAAYVPNNYYLLYNTSGTITIAAVTVQSMGI